MTDWPLYLGLPLWVWIFIAPTLLAFLCFLFRRRTAPGVLAPFWWFLDRAYFAGGLISAGFLILILLIVVAQMAARWTGYSIAGALNFAGYSMACVSFFALAYTLRSGSHIRVSLLLQLTPFTRFWLNLGALYISALIATYFARFAVKANFWSKILNDRTPDQDMVPDWVLNIPALFTTRPDGWAGLFAASDGTWVHTPLWFPQLAMSLGTVLLAVALWDSLIRMLVTGESGIKEESVQ